MHGSIINVPINLNLVQNVLARMPYDDSWISLFLKRKLEYKSIYISAYVRLNMVMKKFRQIYKTPLYKNVDVSIKPNWQGLVELANISQESEIQKKRT